MSTADKHHDLPWLVNKSLSDEERQSMENALNDSQDLRDERDYLDAIYQTVKSHELPEAPNEMAWQRLKRDIQREQKVAQKSQLSSRWRMAAIAASVLVVVQGVFIAMPQQQERDLYTPLSSSSSTKDVGATLSVQFAETATEAEIRALLIENGLRIVDGPSAMGLYTIAVDEAKLDEVEVRLTKLEIVKHVQID